MPRFFRLLFPLVIILVHNVAFAAGFIGAAVYPVTQTPVAALTADFNRDGHLDIATADSVGNNVSVLLGNANGTFGVSTQYASGPCTAIASGDFNGDGNPDLAAVAGAYGLIVLIGKSDGTFVAAAAILFGIKPDGVVVADINGDGKRDARRPDRYTCFWATGTELSRQRPCSLRALPIRWALPSPT